MKQVEPKHVAIVAGVGILAGGIAYFVYTKVKKGKKEQPSQWRLYREMRYGYDTVNSDADIPKQKENDSEPESDSPIVDQEEMMRYKVVTDSKPDISEVLEALKDRDRARKESQSDIDGGSHGTVETDTEPLENTSYGVPKIEFGDDGLPIFNEKEWDSEDGNLEFITQSEYLNSFLHHNKDQAVWFSKSGVMVDSSLTVLDIVDTVGPTAFTTLMREPDVTLFVKNNELETDYEVLTNDSITIEEAWEDRGVI